LKSCDRFEVVSQIGLPLTFFRTLLRNGLDVTSVKSISSALTLWVALTCALFCTHACAGGAAPGADAGPKEGPVITRLSPSSGRAGEAYPIRVTIEGTGFAEDGNIVTFGGIPSDELASSEAGTRITFWVPKEAPGSGEVPPMVLTPGEYQVTVTTPNGTSEPVPFTLTPGDR
jgi:hypothetical protein